MNVLITICARGGSKGIPGKNIKVISGKPLIEYSIILAKQILKKFNAKIALSTDDLEISSIAREAGLDTEYIRPDFLATDTVGKIDTIKDLLLYEESLINKKYDFILDLDVTSPLRTEQDIENAFTILNNNNEALNIFSVSNAERNPYFNMVEQKSNGFFSLVKTNSDGSVMTRQSAPAVFSLNASFYWYKRSFFSSGLESAITHKSLIFLMNHICFDLDNPIDFDFMEYILDNNKLDFKFL